MQWARGRTRDGDILTGIISDEQLHPRTALGAEDAAGAAVKLDDLAMLAPCAPNAFVGLWNNFHAAAEKNGLTPPAHPLFFLKPLTSLAGPGATVEMPADAGRIIFEGELGIVIGRTCRNLSEDDAGDAILGYTCINDFTSVDILKEDPSFTQWTRAKGFDGFGVVGPVIATGLDWRDLTIKVLVNGRERQSYPASDMIMSPARIVSHLSHDMTLRTGDVIACGTSLGARPVKAGDEVEVVIDGIGGVTVTMSAPQADV